MHFNPPPIQHYKVLVYRPDHGNVQIWVRHVPAYTPEQAIHKATKQIYGSMAKKAEPDTPPEAPRLTP